jgi:hypothetical protein
MHNFNGGNEGCGTPLAAVRIKGAEGAGDGAAGASPGDESAWERPGPFPRHVGALVQLLEADSPSQLDADLVRGPAMGQGSTPACI